MFKANKFHITYFKPCSSVFIVIVEQVNVDWELVSQKSYNVAVKGADTADHINITALNSNACNRYHQRYKITNYCKILILKNQPEQDGI